jgi:biotin carboxylase
MNQSMNTNNHCRINCCVLQTCIGGTMSTDLILSLKQDPVLDIKIVGVDANQDHPSKFLVDVFYKVPFGTDEGYGDTILQIIKTEKVQVIIPGSDQEAFVLSALRDQLDQLGVTITTSPTPVLDLIRNKLTTYRELESSGISLPNYCSVDSLVELKSAFKFFQYPEKSIILKPIDGRGGRGLRVLESPDDVLPAWIGNGLRENRYNYIPNDQELGEWLNEGPLMVMPALRDPAYDVDLVAVKGKAEAIIIRRRHNPVGIPFTGNTLEVNERIYDYCKKIASALNLDGLHDIDLMTDIEGYPVLLEVNPRMSGSVSAAHIAGYPVVALAIANMLGIAYPFKLPTENKEIKVFTKCVVV